MFDPQRYTPGFRELLAPDTGGSSGGSLPSSAEVSILAECVVDAASLAAKTSDVRVLDSAVDRVGEVGLRGVLHLLDREERIKLARNILPLLAYERNGASELMRKLLDASRSLIDLAEITRRIGADQFENSPGHRWIAGRLALGDCAYDIKGEEYLTEIRGLNFDKLPEAIESIDRILKNNAEVLERYGEILNGEPYAFNADMLHTRFNERKFEALNMITHDPPGALDFVRAWSERIKVHTQYGIGIFDPDNMRLSGNELTRLRQGIFKYPPATLLLDGLVLRMDFASQPPNSPTALGSYGMSRIFLYPALREAVTGIDCPLDTDEYSYTAAHELAHCCQTKCLETFKDLSGWIYVANCNITDPLTKHSYSFAPDDITPGSIIKFNDARYIISDYEEDAMFDFGLFKDEAIRFKNPYSRAGSRWAYREGSSFVSEYAAESPFEDFAESMAHALLLPEILQKNCPNKALFMKYVYGISIKE